MPEDTDFLAGRSKCLEEEKAIKFLISPFTIGQSEVISHKLLLPQPRKVKEEDSNNEVVFWGAHNI